MKFDMGTFFDSFKSRGTAGDRETYEKGYHGLGDPDDKTLNDIEIKIAIPSWEKDIIVRDYCNHENQVHKRCYDDTHFYNRFYTCSEPKSKLNECVEYWKTQPDLKKRATAEYLEERRLFRSTGLTKTEREMGTTTKDDRSDKLLKKVRSVLLKDEEMKQHEEKLKQKEN